MTGTGGQLFALSQGTEDGLLLEINPSALLCFVEYVLQGK